MKKTNHRNNDNWEYKEETPRKNKSVKRGFDKKPKNKKQWENRYYKGE